MQAFALIIMSLLPPELGDAINSNLLAQVTSLSLVASAYFDPGIDVPHTLVATQFSFLFSIVRITSYDLPLSLIRSESGKRIVSRMWLLDIFFRSCLVAFNYTVWSAIMELQQLDSVCPDGMGKWYFFGASMDLRFPGTEARFAYVFCILDIAWEASRLPAEFMRMLWTVYDDPSSEFQLGFDPRFWVFRRVIDSIISYFRGEYSSYSIDWTSLYHGARLQSIFFKFLVLLYIVLSVELIVGGNGLATENAWNFGQIFAMANTFGLWCVLLVKLLYSQESRAVIMTILRGLLYIPAAIAAVVGFYYPFSYSHDLFHRVYPLDKPLASSGVFCIPVNILGGFIGLFCETFIVALPLAIVYQILRLLGRWLALIANEVAVFRYAFEFELLEERV